MPDCGDGRTAHPLAAQLPEPDSGYADGSADHASRSGARPAGRVARPQSVGRQPRAEVRLLRLGRTGRRTGVDGGTRYHAVQKGV